MTRSRLLAWIALAGAVATTTGCMAHRLSVARELAANAERFSAAPEHPERRILVVGDSTGLGTGADAAADSVPGRIGAAHPRWLIDNLAENGAKYDDAATQLEGTQKRYDLVLVIAGGNDVMRLTSASRLRQDITRTVRLAQAHAPTVVLMPMGNVGHAPFFFPPISWLMSSRSKELHAMVQQIASESGARYIRLLQPPENDPFALQPKKMHAADGLHPSSQGYAQWFEQLLAQGGLAAAADR